MADKGKAIIIVDGSSSKKRKAAHGDDIHGNLKRKHTGVIDDKDVKVKEKNDYSDDDDVFTGFNIKVKTDTTGKLIAVQVDKGVGSVGSITRGDDVAFEVVSKRARMDKGKVTAVSTRASLDSSKVDRLCGVIDGLNKLVNDLADGTNTNAVVKQPSTKVQLQQDKTIAILQSKQNQDEIARRSTRLTRRSPRSSSSVYPKGYAVLDKEIGAVEKKAKTEPGDKIVGEFLVKILKKKEVVCYLDRVHTLCDKYLRANGVTMTVTVDMLTESIKRQGLIDRISLHLSETKANDTILRLIPKTR